MAFPLAYTEHRPPGDLAGWVACFWRIVGGATGHAATDFAAGAANDGGSFLHRVLPDGCADLLFDLEAARGSGGAPADLIGPMSVAQVFELRGSIDLLGVRLRPGAIAVFGGIPADQLLDTAIPLSDLPVSLGINIAQLADIADSAAQLRLVINACRKRIAALNQPDPTIGHALARWAGAERPDFPVISVLTRDLGLSERAFERRFLTSVGLTPIRYRRLARLRTVLRLHADGVRGWAAIAATTGFSDQAHLVRDCRAFTGLTPTEWAASQVDRAGFLQDGHVTTL
jgi:AraC-like DNA-binding protein